MVAVDNCSLAVEHIEARIVDSNGAELHLEKVVPPQAYTAAHSQGKEDYNQHLAKDLVASKEMLKELDIAARLYQPMPQGVVMMGPAVVPHSAEVK